MPGALAARWMCRLPATWRNPPPIHTAPSAVSASPTIGLLPDDPPALGDLAAVADQRALRRRARGPGTGR